jgi:hypothetical protein
MASSRDVLPERNGPISAMQRVLRPEECPEPAPDGVPLGPSDCPMVSSFPLPGFVIRVERYEAQRDTRVAQPRASLKERDKQSSRHASKDA